MGNNRLWKKVLVYLMTFMMVFSTMPTSVFADGENNASQQPPLYAVHNKEAISAEETNGIYLNKQLSMNDNGTGMITLETYVTGRVETKSVPTDIILVLDQSGSMDEEDIEIIKGYNNVSGTASQLYDNRDSLYVKTGEDEYQKVNISREVIDQQDTYISYSGKRNNVYYEDRDSLYHKHEDGTYGKVTVNRSGRQNYTYTYSCSGCELSISFSGSNTTPNNTADFYYKSTTNIYEYTFSYDNNGTVVTETVNSDTVPNWDFYTKSTEYISRLAALKSSVTAFAESVEAKAQEEDVDHTISIVGFGRGDYGNDSYLNSEVFVGADTYEYGTEASDQYANAPQDMSTTAGVENINESIDALDANGGTYVDLGVEMANGILKAMSENEGDENRNKVVIVFTDGAPGYNGQWGGGPYDYDERNTKNAGAVADAALEQIYVTKHTYGATVYTAGIFEGADAGDPKALPDYTPDADDEDADNANRFMHLLSSNYPDAESMTTPGDINSNLGDGDNYYLSARDAESIDEIFDTIAENVKQLALNESTIIRDVMADGFIVPAGTNTSDIKISIATYAGNGNFSDPVSVSNNDYTISIDTEDVGEDDTTQTVSVNGFDFEPVIDKNDGTYQGKKLILEIPIKVDEDFEKANSGQTVPSNNFGVLTSSVIKDQQTKWNFAIPEVTMPVWISGNKTWDDNNNQDGKRPESITINLLANEKIIDSVEVTPDEAGNWNYAFSKQPKFDLSGNEIVYTITEDTVEGYDDPVINGFDVVNKYTPETTEATVIKVWDDAENQDGKRPESLTVTLSNGTEVTLTEANKWTATVKDLPKYADGKEISYTWTEDEEGLPAGYTLTGNSKEGTVTTLTNSYTPEVTEATVVKVWDDAENQDGKRPESLTVTLKADNETIETVTLSEDNEWTAKVSNLPKYANGQEITYTWTEDEEGLPAGYELTDTKTEGKVTTLTNSYTPEKTGVTVTKVWNDNENADEVRPNDVTVVLKANGNAVGDAVTLNEANKWTHEWTGLDKYSEGELIKYTIDEIGVDETKYSFKVEKGEGNDFTVTNTHPAVIDVAVKKVWDDAENQDGFRADSVTINLYKDNELFKTVELNEENNWSHTWEGLTKYNNDNNRIEYTVDEEEVDGYTKSITGDMDAGFIVTNTHTPELTEATVIKVWNDAENQDGKRPTELKVTLSDGTEVTLNERNGWTATVENLPKFADGKEIVYSWTEGDLPEGYELTDTTVSGTITTLTNSYTPEETEVTVKKVWDDANNQDGKRPESIEVELSNGTKVTLNDANKWTATVEGLPKYANGEEIEYTWKEIGLPEVYTLTGNSKEGTVTTLTNSHTPETTELTVKKVWDDAENQDGKRPESVTAVLKSGDNVLKTVTLTQDNQWTATVKDLPKYANGQVIDYTWTEENVPEGYKLTNTEENGTVTTLTNTHVPEETSVTVEKVWNDNNDDDNVRPKAVTVVLKANGEKVGDSIILDADNNWSYQWTNLAKNNAGKLIEYKVYEEGIDEKLYSVKVEGEDNNFTIINTHPARTDVTVTKAWDDNNNQDGIRPGSVEVQLYANGEAAGEAVTLNANNNWTKTWEDLIKYDDNEALIEYTIDEVKVDGYTTTIKGDMDAGFTVTNTHEPELTEATVIKVWNDAENQDGKRPAELKVTLSNGTEVTLNEANQWTATVENLPKYADGKEIKYTWTEDEEGLPESYELTDTKTEGKITTLTNSYTPETTEATVKKVWDDAENQDGKRPTELKVTLNNGTEVTLNEANQWTATVEDLPKYADGKEIKYTWTENEEGLPAGYKLTDTNTEGKITTLTNSYTPETTEATVVKAWNDAENQDGKRPESLTVTLSNGTEVILNEANQWTATVENLPKYADGEEINYTWTEDEEGLPAGYKLTDTKTEGKITTLTNSYTPETTEATVVKAWNDAENQDGKRPAELKVTLSNGTEVTLNEANQWTATVEGLPKYADGEEINYTWTEDEEGLPAGYKLTDTKTEGKITTLTNSYTPETTEATVVKAWNDAENQDGKRPAELKVTLSNGTEVTLNEANQWTATVENLPKYADGEEINYTWTEDEEGLPAGYKLTDTKTEGKITTLTNSYTPELTKASIKKIWNDFDNNDGKRPTSLTVTLYGNGTRIDDIVLNSNNNWSATVDDLPKYEGGKEIAYTWTENLTVEDYALSNYETDGTTTKITNIYPVKETVAVTINKIWDDADNQDGKRPENLTVTLSNGTVVTLNEDNKWTATVEKLPKYDDGQIIEYTWAEDEAGLPEGYELTDTKINGAVTTLTNSYTPEITEATVTKVWDDEGNQDGKRPESLTVTLSNGIETVETVTLSAENQWTATVNDLPKYSNGQIIEYTWTEDETDLPEGYELTDAAVEGTTTTLTNSYTPEETATTIIKEWSDADNQDGKRPENLTVTLSNDTEIVETVILSAENKWTATVNDLPKYSNGQIIEYTWAEDEAGLPEGYELTDTEVDGDVTTLTNSYTPETTELTVTKVWDDANNQDGKRPGELKVTLSDGTEVTLNEANGWTATVKDLPKYANGQKITYTWTEEGLPEGYELTKTEANGTITTLTNKHTPEKTEMTVKKVWDDAENQDGKRPGSLEVTLKNGEDTVETVTLSEANQWTATVEGLDKYADGKEIEYTWTEDRSGLPEGYELTETAVEGTTTTLTNSYTPEETEATIVKAWDDTDNQDGKRPRSLEVTLSNGIETVETVTLNERNQWTETIENLPKYADGKLITYVWEEADITDYELTATSKKGTVTTLTNTYPPEIREATVVKVWDDADNQDGKRPAELTVTLSNGTEDVETVILSEDNQWTATVENLPVYAAGEKLVYTWTESGLPEGYELTNTVVEGTITTLTNSYTPETTEMTVKKVWNDEGNQDGKRPESLLVTLNNGTKDVATVTLSERNQWTATVKNLPVYAAGEQLVYKWTEATVEGYELTSTSSEGTLTTLTNKHTPETTEMTVKKVWDDAGNQDGKRPESLEVTLSNGTEDVETVILSEDNQWTATVTDLPKFKAGEEITYSWTEETVEDYELTGNSKEGTVTTLTNKHTPEKTEASVIKVWDDADNQDGKRPAELTVTLSNGTDNVGTVTLNEGNKWTATVTDLPKFKAGEEITYSWTEETVEDYELTSTSSEGIVTTLTNKHTPEETEATVTKVWDDADNQDGKRPAELTVTLSNGTETVETVTLSEENQWTATIENLPVYEAGVKLVYTWTEGEMPEGYELTATSSEGTATTLTNSYEPEVKEATVKKIWEDADNQDGKRPESLEVTLSNGTEDVETVILSEDNQWTVTVENLPVYKAGEKLVYTWTEASVDEYELTGTAENGTITLLTNTHVPETTELTVYKNWKDKHDKYDTRPEEITVYLEADGEIVQTVQITEADKWRYTFSELPVYADGEEIVYTISEEPVDGYITEVKDMVITNTIDPDELDKFADTGDDSKPWAYGFAGLMAMITAAGTLFIRRRED